jgi:NAD(P) transhydrogenase subunit alpha
MKVGVPRETFPAEQRVALIPASCPKLQKAGIEVVVERGAGERAGYSDQEYQHKGARVADRAEVFQAEVIAQVRAYGTNPEAGREDLARFRPGQVAIGLADPLSYPGRAADFATTGATLFALELIPRITRAQGMDVLSSMATVAGYRAVLLAANLLPKMFPMLMTAAGTVQPARVLIVGAGVAGLQAIATAKRLGAIVSAYDVRPAVKEQVQSLGAKFVELALETRAAEGRGGYAEALGEDFYRRQQTLMAEVVRTSDVVITTASIPGKPSPVLVTDLMVQNMQPGSVIVDLAAERGGNCALTKLGQTVHAFGVTILGPDNLPSTVPFHASQMFSNNLTGLLGHLTKDGALRFDLEDEITKETLVCRDGALTHPRVLSLDAESRANRQRKDGQ